jgi:hypothetical protein
MTKGKLLFIRTSGKSVYELDYAKYLLENNKNECFNIRKMLKQPNFKPHNISKEIWLKALKIAKCEK